MKKTIASLLTWLMIFTLGHPVFAQNSATPPLLNSSSFGQGQFYAPSYNWNTSVYSGGGTTGSYTITVFKSQVVLPDKRYVSVFATNAPITIGQGAAQETVTPSAVSTGCSQLNAPNASCTVTATFTNAHGQGDAIYSGTFGLQESINDAQSHGGGNIVIDDQWTALGGTNAIIVAAGGYSNVGITSLRGGNIATWSLQPSTLTALATPATLVGSATCGGATTFCSNAVTGTWAAVATFGCNHYVDALGGISPCGATANFTATVNKALQVSSPAASTGAVGFIPAVGVTSLATAYIIPVTAAMCTLTTLETVVPACAIGSAATIPSPITTGPLRAGYTVNTYDPVFQSHTTFAYSPVGRGQPFQTNYGPFPATGNIPAGNVAVLGSFPLSSGTLNFIGRSLRISGKLVLTGVNTATLKIAVMIGDITDFTTGTPIAECVLVNTTNLTGAANNEDFQCRLTTNAIGATGSIMPAGFYLSALQAGTTAGNVAIDTNTAAVTTDVLDQDFVYIVITAGTAAINPAQLVDLHVETL